MFRTTPGGSWGSQGMIAFENFAGATISQQVSDAGGTPHPLTRLEKGEVSHAWPEFLPGGKAVLFAVAWVTAIGPTGRSLSSRLAPANGGT